MQSYSSSQELEENVVEFVRTMDHLFIFCLLNSRSILPGLKGSYRADYVLIYVVCMGNLSELDHFSYSFVSRVVGNSVGQLALIPPNITYFWISKLCFLSYTLLAFNL